MSNSYRYFYRLGHQPHMGVEEYHALTGDVSNTFISDQWLLSNQSAEVHQSGSLVYGGEILGVWKITDALPILVENTLIDYIQSQPLIKKLGLGLGKFDTDRLFNRLKQLGVKKINRLANTIYPNYGHWKQTKSWFIVFTFINEEGMHVALGKINAYSDQEFWQELDSGLPVGDMSRGLMNLKLARTILNLTNRQVIWDPFAGNGRVVVAGLDIKEQFYTSDIDGDQLALSVAQNVEFATRKFAQHQRRFHPDQEQKLAVLQEHIALDARNLTQASFVSEFDLSRTAIVTEGYLGKNFQYSPNAKEIDNELVYQRELWTSVLDAAQHVGIQEIVGCVPFYPGQNIIPEFIQEIATGKKYTIIHFHNTPYLLYSRPKSNVGHCIFRLLLHFS